MKVKISVLQLSLITANFIFTTTLINLPQIIIDIGAQNAWMLPFIAYPIVVSLILIIIGKKKNWKAFHRAFNEGNKSLLSEKLLILLVLLFIGFAFIKDLRAMTDYMATKLLPTTPIIVITILIILTLIYMASSGFEVIARVTSLTFVFLLIVIFMLPFMLLNEINPENLQPILGFEMLPGLAKSLFILISWVGEFTFSLFLFAFIHPMEDGRKGLLAGTAVGLGLILLLLVLEVTVLGVKLVSISTYPTIQLIQLINITDFLDRLDLVLVTLWLPTCLSKIGLELYIINKGLGILFKHRSNLFLTPVAMILGLLSILLFENNMDHLNFSYFSWPSLGLALELSLIFFFLLVKRGRIKKARQGNKPAAEK